MVCVESLDDVGRIRFRLDAPSGHYQRHLNSVLDFAERQSQFYNLQVVGTQKQDASRSTFDMCVVPGHEVFTAEVEGDAGFVGATLSREGEVVKRNPSRRKFSVA